VPREELPADVRRFINTDISSVGQLEVLLLLRGAADKSWTAEQVARALVMLPSAAAGWLEQIAAGGLLAEDGSTYRYAPPTNEVERTIDRLAESYARYRLVVVGLIFSKPSGGVADFPEAFRIRRREG
jgi:hypothetical protein